MTIERTCQGAYRISQVYKGYLFTRTYFGYTKREAITAFRQELKRLNEE